MKGQPPQRSISAPDFHRLCAAGTAHDLIDVRTAPEFLGSHVKGARSLPLHELDAGAFLQQRGDREAPLYVVCQSGMRAAKAVDEFERAGFHGCVLVEGGMNAWRDAGLPVEQTATRVLPLQQQVHLIVGLSGILGALLAIFADEWFAVIPLVTGCGLTINGLTGWCGLGLILARMPWNKARRCNPTACCEGNIV